MGKAVSFKCTAHEREWQDGCVGCLKAQMLELKAENRLMRNARTQHSAALDRHGVIMRNDVAPAITAFLAGLVENGTDAQLAIQLADTHLVWLLNNGGGKVS